jgi:hypothetical protein
MNRIYIIAVLILCISCSPWKWVERNEETVCNYCTAKYVRDSIKNTVQVDTFKSVIRYPVKDSASLELYLKCDSMNNVFIVNALNYKGKFVISEYLLKNNVLILRSKIDSLNVVKEQLRIEKLKTHEVIKVIKEPQNKRLINLNYFNMGVIALLGMLSCIILIVLHKR